MKIAVSYNKSDAKIESIFENSRFFKFYDVVGNSVICSEMIGTMGAKEKEELVHILLMFETDALICGDINDETRELLSEEGITYFSGCAGLADDVVELALAGKLCPA